MSDSSWRAYATTSLAGRLQGAVRDIGLHLEMRLEELLELFRLQLADARRRGDGEVDRGDDARERSDVRQEIGDLVVRACHAEAITVRIELITIHDTVRLHVRQLEPRVSCGGGDRLQQRRHLVFSRHE